MLLLDPSNGSFKYYAELGNVSLYDKRYASVSYQLSVPFTQ